MKNQKVFTWLIALIFTALLVSCENVDYAKTEDGLVYRIIKTGSGDYIKPGTYLKVHQSLRVGDSVLYETFGKIAAYGRFDSLTTPSHDFLDILEQMRVGDSAIVIRQNDTLAKRKLLQYNTLFKKGGNMKVILKVMGVFDSEAKMMATREKDFEDFKQTEIKELKQWLDSKGIKDVKPLNNGVFVKTTRAGSGILLDTGMIVSVNYTGKLKNGEVFDTNSDTTRHMKGPFKIALGVGEGIQGFELGIKSMRLGEKATIYMPSLMAYGQQGSPPKIPPFSPLIFDVEIVGVEPAKPTEPKAVKP